MNKENVLNKTVSHTAAIFPILLALNKFEEKGISFNGETHDQKVMLSLLEEANNISVSDEQVKSFISDNVRELNEILRENGFNIQFNEKQPFDLGVVTIMELFGTWLQKATESNIEYDGKRYDAAYIKNGVSMSYDDVLTIRTREGLMVFVEIADKERSGLELFKYLYIKAQRRTHNETPCKVIIPLVEIDDQPDISWLAGMHSINPRFTITQALQQNRLKITTEGVRAESAVALGGMRGITIDENPTITIDKPFNIWLAYGNPELQYFPLFCAYVAPDTWKESK